MMKGIRFAFFLMAVMISSTSALAQIKRESPDSTGSIFPDAVVKASLSESNFTWGADIGASIDLGGYDMSTFDLDLNFGYKNNFFRMIGVGAGVHRSFESGNNFIPVYALLRTSFTTRPSLFFLNLKAGYSFNTVADEPLKGGLNLSLGCGINLAMSKRFKTHIILSYGYFRMNEQQQIAAGMKVNHINQAQVRFGVNF